MLDCRQGWTDGQFPCGRRGTPLSRLRLPKGDVASVSAGGSVPLHTSYRTGQQSVGQTMGLWDRPSGRRDRCPLMSPFLTLG
eukprot:227980-Chlamydomonas_euryale.AAC.3